MQLDRVRPVRRAIGPLVSGLQRLPSVAWVPAAIIWFGLPDATIYFVVLMGAVPSVANAMVSGLDQVPPLFARVGRVLGATGLSSARHVLHPASILVVGIAVELCLFAPLERRVLRRRGPLPSS